MADCGRLETTEKASSGEAEASPDAVRAAWHEASEALKVAPSWWRSGTSDSAKIHHADDKIHAQHHHNEPKTKRSFEAPLAALNFYGYDARAKHGWPEGPAADAGSYDIGWSLSSYDAAEAAAST